MATRLKNILYNTYVKMLVATVIIISVLILNIIYVQNLNHYEAMFKQTFYETENFQEQYVRLSHNVVELHLELVDKANIVTNYGMDDVRLTRYQRIMENLERGSSFQYLLFNRDTGQYFTNVDTNPDTTTYEIFTTALDEQEILKDALVTNAITVNELSKNNNEFKTSNSYDDVEREAIRSVLANFESSMEWDQTG